MKRQITAFTILETLIGVSLLAVIVAGILGILVVVMQYFVDGLAMATSQATARMAIERIVRPYVREGMSFDVPVENNGDVLIVTNYESAVDTFTFVDDDGDEETFLDNRLERNGSIIGLNIVKIPGTPVFQEIEENERVAINFGVRNQGKFGNINKEVRISTEIQLRN